MLQKVLNISSKELFFLDTIPQEDILKIKKMFHLKNTGIPIEQILWETDFYGYIFFLNEHTLIPKNDTEGLVEKAIEYIKWQNKKMSLVDVWTGTGCIPMAILKQLPGEILESYGIDISPQALAIAKKNSAFHWLLEKLILIEWDYLPLFKIRFLKIWLLRQTSHIYLMVILIIWIMRSLIMNHTLLFSVDLRQDLNSMKNL